MDRLELDKNIKIIVDYNNEVLASLKEIYSWIENENESREILDEFLDFVGLPKNKKTRLWAYFRIVDLQENSLELYLEENEFEQNHRDEILNLAFEYVSEFHYEMQAELLKFVQDNKLLTPFFEQVLKWTLEVWKAFNNFFIPWRSHIIFWVNRDLENKFDNSGEKIIDYLNLHNLFDFWHFWEIADRSYSALVFENGKYVSKSYFDVFKAEINAIIKSLDKFIKNISSLEDEIFDSKNDYIAYLTALKNAFLERDTNSLVEKWSKVDEAWMSIKTPFQIGHPLEFYEDKYRKAVAPEWDLRIDNRVFESVVESDIENMYELIFDDIWREKFKKSYEFSLSNIKRVQLYLTSPVLYFWAEITGLFSAQVVPNDEVISDRFGKKIFAFPEMVLKNKRAKPFMKLQSEIFDEKLLDDYRKYIFLSDENFYKVYDVETIGHEFWHTLWLDLDSESVMNKKTWLFKNIEEFKATSGWLVAYFMGKNDDFELSEHLLRDHIMRTIWLLAYKKVNEIEPYYCEALIHLSVLVESEIIEIKDNKIYFNFDEKNYSSVKEKYFFHYKKLIDVYLNKLDAFEFLKDYAINKNGYFMPVEKELYDFVDYYYDLYKKIWNEVDEKTDKNKYKNT